MQKHLFEFDCPCCGKRIEVDVRSGSARAVRFEDSERGKDLDGLLQSQSGEAKRVESAFDRAAREHERQADRLDQVFRRAAEEAEHDQTKRPSNPFDLE